MAEQSQPKSVAVIGGGITGLVLAQGLLKVGRVAQQAACAAG